MKKYQNEKRRGDSIKTVLAILAGSAFLTLELIDEVFGGTKSVYKNKARRKNSIFFNSEQDYNTREIQRFYSLLSKLKSQGFIKKKQVKRGSFWNITQKGLEKLGILNKKRKIEYEPKPGNKVKIIVFDISEYERWKRGWLREALTALEFVMFQKSVWIGKNKIPEQFFEDLREMRLLPHVHVLEVSASGTLRELS